MPSCFSALFFSALLLAHSLPVAQAGTPSDGWILSTHEDNLTIYTRPHDGTSVRECKAITLFDAEPIVVKRVLDDTAEYPKFMPYVVETKTIQHTLDGRVGYQRISPPLVGDRDYTVRR